MVSENPITVRIKFRKFGSLMYISHLDLQRTMQRIFVRSGINIWYTEGFNPQPRVVFAIPLPVGVESDCELMDIKITDNMNLSEIRERLADSFPAEMEVCDVYYPKTKFKDISFIQYRIEIVSPEINEDFYNTVSHMFESECCIYKKVKDQEKKINISEHIESISVGINNKSAVIETVLCADNEKYLNPELLVRAIKENTSVLKSVSMEEYYSINREKMLQKDLSEFI